MKLAPLAENAGSDLAQGEGRFAGMSVLQWVPS
jgi:hypothetical protein